MCLGGRQLTCTSYRFCCHHMRDKPRIQRGRLRLRLRAQSEHVRIVQLKATVRRVPSVGIATTLPPALYCTQIYSRVVL